MAIAAELVGNLLIGPQLGLGYIQDDATPENQRLRRRVRADKPFQRLTLFRGKVYAGAERTWHWLHPCRKTYFPKDAKMPRSVSRSTGNGLMKRSSSFSVNLQYDINIKAM
jgi:hypothetical protein